MPGPPLWIQTPDALTVLARALADTEFIALDTEADSLHHYPERLCLVQLADAEGRTYLIDPLALPDLEPLRPLCADPATLKLFHSAENDLTHFKRRYAFTFAGIADTMLAARFLGIRELGLDRLLERTLAVQTTKSQQKTDWARRPLTHAQEAYAAEDVRHLHALYERLLGELRARGRDAWLTEECAAVAAQSVTERPADSDGYRRIRGASRLDPSGLAVLRALHAQREEWARAEHRPPFKVLSPETLVALAQIRPRVSDGLAGIPGFPPRLAHRYGEGVLSAIARGLAEPVPTVTRAPRRVPSMQGVVHRRAAALKRWRAAAAERTALDPGVLLPQRLIDTLAADPPRDIAALDAAPGIRRWRVEAFGQEILTALAGPDAEPTP